MKKFLFKIRDLLAAVIECILRPILHKYLYEINRLNQENISTAIMHQKSFPQFKNINAGKDVVIVACGPTAADYTPIPNAVHIGVNRAFKLTNIKLNYLFIHDTGKNMEMLGELPTTEQYPCTRFYGTSNEPDAETITFPESHTIKDKSFRYRTDRIDWTGVCNSAFRYDISTQPLADFGSVVFPALQFALWTNPCRIFLVGCDCSLNGHFHADTVKQWLPLDQMLLGYNEFKRHARKFYPDTEIISINPVGLKGIFKDWYQKDGAPMPK